MLQRLLLAPILLVAAATYMYPVQATFSTAVYPSVTPIPKSITRQFKTVSIVNPKNVHINIGCMQENTLASAHYASLTACCFQDEASFLSKARVRLLSYTHFEPSSLA